MTASANRSKGDEDPAIWKPPTQTFWCDYATWWATVKVRWALTAHRAEVDTLRSMLAGCDAGGGPTTTTTGPPPPPGGLAFGTMQCDAPGTPDVNEEWVELLNGGGSAAALAGWKIRDEGPNYTYTFPDLTLGAGGRVKLHTGSGANTATDLYWGQASHVWNNTGVENAYLVDTHGAEVTKKSCR